MDIVGYVLGHTYDVEIRRVICPEVGLDAVSGIDVPCISELHRVGSISTLESQPCAQASRRIRYIHPPLPAGPYHGDDGTRRRCTPLLSRHRIAATSVHRHPLTGPERQGNAVEHPTSIAGCDESATRLLETAARAPRHGQSDVVPETDAVKLLTTAWAIADGYILNC
jgi:hypothetical protein